MRKLRTAAFVIAAMCLCFGMTGCGSDDDDKSSRKSKTTSSSVPAK